MARVGWSAGAVLGIFVLAGGARGGESMFLSEADVMGVIGQLTAKQPQAEAARIERGVKQAARLWTKEDGSPEQFAKFAAEAFATGAALDALFERFEAKSEQIRGHFDSLVLQLRLEMDEDRGPPQPIDLLFAAWDPSAHVQDDMFGTKLAFAALLNFPLTTLEQRLADGDRWSRRQWAETRLAQQFAHRVPAAVQQAVTEAYARADNYIANYNIAMDHLLGPDGKPAFRAGLKLISHWGLRDELKAMYADSAALPKQELIQTAMLRILNQEIPAVVIDNAGVNWDPVANTVDGQPAEREPDRRFAVLLDVFRAHRQEDPFYPDMPSHIDRRFQAHREIPEAEVEALLAGVLRAPVGHEVAALISKRLGRKLQPFDIWYDGFKARGALDQDVLDRTVRERYPTLEAFQAALPDTLGKLGFSPETARFLAERIEVDPARGAGHAWGPQMRTAKAHLRTRVPKDGMDYKGFNIAMHELGHNVEQVFSLYRVDHTLLAGVPNTAFTEGFAFVFQARDLDVLGLAKPDPKRAALAALDDFWSTREIAGVGLLDMRVWRWMYAHPQATPAELRAAVVELARGVWNEFYAETFGVKDSPLLAIYSHMISSGLYLPDYPLGHIIAFQVEDFFRSHPLGTEMERLCALGSITPNAWMRQAVGAPISAKPLLDSAAKALKVVGR